MGERREGHFFKFFFNPGWMFVLIFFFGLCDKRREGGRREKKRGRLGR